MVELRSQPALRHVAIHLSLWPDEDDAVPGGIAGVSLHALGDIKGILIELSIRAAIKALLRLLGGRGSHRETATVIHVEPMPLPLSGLLVVSLEQAVAAPMCTCRLADAGARVIKVERPEGDFARGFDDYVQGQSTYSVWTNRGKESCRVDLKKPEDLALVGAMLAKADVFVQNLAPGATERLGLGAASLRARHPRLIVCEISGYAPGTPDHDHKAYDLLIQAEVGLASITGTKDSGPSRVGVSILSLIHI